MSRLPVEVNPFRFVEQRKSLSGRLPVSQLPRLGELLASTEGEVDVQLDFTVNVTGLPVIEGEVGVDLDFRCQRCLKTVTRHVQSSVNTVLVTSDEEAQRLQDGHDSWLVEDERLFLRDFIEDELLLVLPISVMHDECEPVRPLIEGLPEDEMNEESEEAKQNPFAALKNLKDRQH